MTMAEHEKYQRLIEAAKSLKPVTTAVAHPCDESSLTGAVDAAKLGLITPILVGPKAKIEATAAQFNLDISRYEQVDVPHSQAAAEKAVQLVREGMAEALKALAASDFFTVEVWSWSGLVTYYILFVMELATRRVCIAGITTNPDTQWMLQMARQLTDSVDGILLGKRYLILDRDTKYCPAFRDFVKREGIAVIRLPPRSPNLNAYAERWVRGVRDECLSRLIPIGQGMLWRAFREHGAHFHHERNHQGLGNVLVMPQVSSTRRVGPVIRRPRLGGLLNHYEQAPAQQTAEFSNITGHFSCSCSSGIR